MSNEDTYRGLQLEEHLENWCREAEIEELETKVKETYEFCFEISAMIEGCFEFILKHDGGAQFLKNLMIDYGVPSKGFKRLGHYIIAEDLKKVEDKIL